MSWCKERASRKGESVVFRSQQQLTPVQAEHALGETDQGFMGQQGAPMGLQEHGVGEGPVTLSWVLDCIMAWDSDRTDGTQVLSDKCLTG